MLDFQFTELYTCPNVKCQSTDLYVNAGPARPFRAPGHPQASWALEQMLDALAEAAKLDPVELRLKNIPTYSQSELGNPPYTSTGLKQCLEEGAMAFGWKEKRAAQKAKQEGHIRTGIGMASALWFRGGGRPPSTVPGASLLRRQRKPQHGRERPRHRNQDDYGHDSWRRAWA